MKIIRTLILILLFCIGAFSHAQTAEINSLQLHTLVDSLSGQIRRHYIDSTLINSITAHLKSQLDKGAYSKISNPDALAARLTRDIQSISKDAHFHVLHFPEMLNEITGNIEDVPRMMQQKLDKDRQKNFGLKRAEILPGNIGLLEISQFVRLNPYSREAVNTAFAYLKNTKALIIDLRYGSGGSPEMMSFIAGKFFKRLIKLADIYIRSEKVKIPCVAQPDSISDYFLDKPIVILVSYRTFSAAEALAYTLQHQGRAVIVGENTRGGAHMVNYQPLSSGFVVDIPLGTFISSATGSNWEKTGVKPDIVCNHAEAVYSAGMFLFDKYLISPDNTEFISGNYQKYLFEGRFKASINFESTKFIGTFSTGKLFMEGGTLYHQETGRAKNPMVVINNYWIKPAHSDQYLIELKRNDLGKIIQINQFSEDGRIVSGTIID